VSHRKPLGSCSTEYDRTWTR
jgi:hypothetical protein